MSRRQIAHSGVPWQACPGMRFGQCGFTLLEVMVALAILATALALVARSQQSSMRAVGRARQMTTAVMLARNFMVEYEDELLDDGFPELNEDDDGDFADEGYPEFRYKLLTEKIELPTVDANAVGDAVKGDGDGDDESGVSGMMAQGASVMGQYFELFRNVIEQSIRRVQLEVSWSEGKQQRAISVTSYFTDPRRIESIPSFGAGAPGASSGTTPPAISTTPTAPAAGGR